MRLQEPFPAGFNVLQWSREQLLAEMASVRRAGLRSGGFNGAASSCSRNFDGREPPPMEDLELQWSREQLLAEIKACCGGPVRDVAGFNGAASSCSRK